ncbi:MAG: FHA domain-containing protein, partial [Microcystis panniformis]
MITLTLVHPSQSTPLQHWQFDNDQSTILIGRALDNHVVLYSAV